MTRRNTAGLSLITPKEVFTGVAIGARRTATANASTLKSNADPRMRALLMVLRLSADLVREKVNGRLRCQWAVPLDLRPL